MQKITKENHEYNKKIVSRCSINEVLLNKDGDEPKIYVVQGYYFDKDTGLLRIRALDVYANEVLLVDPIRV